MKNPYAKFYVNCISLYADSQIICRHDKNTFPKLKLTAPYTKITKDGKLAFGVCYFFTSKKEREQLTSCNTFCIDGFVAIAQKRNIYGFVCRTKKNNSIWEISEGETCQIYHNTNINSLRN